jgi:hypothetical protein
MSRPCHSRAYAKQSRPAGERTPAGRDCFAYAPRNELIVHQKHRPKCSKPVPNNAPNSAIHKVQLSHAIHIRGGVPYVARRQDRVRMRNCARKAGRARSSSSRHLWPPPCPPKNSGGEPISIEYAAQRGQEIRFAKRLEQAAPGHRLSFRATSAKMPTTSALPKAG